MIQTRCVEVEEFRAATTSQSLSQIDTIAETVHPFANETFDLSDETAVADMLRWAESLEKA